MGELEERRKPREWFHQEKNQLVPSVLRTKGYQVPTVVSPPILIKFVPTLFFLLFLFLIMKHICFS